jgi:26S proteasome regulatory subunit N6
LSKCLKIHLFKKIFYIHIKALKDYKTELSDDPVIHSHLGTLYDNLLEQNLSRLLEPFSNVQIEHIARLINLPQVYFIHKCLTRTNLLLSFLGHRRKETFSNDFR